MSIADHFEQAPDARYIRDYDVGAARRQFNLSVLLVAAFALVAMTLGTVLRFDAPTAQASAPSAIASAPPAYAGKL